MRVLLVEDDNSLAVGLRDALSREGFVADHVASGSQALAAVRADAPDIVVLDLNHPLAGKTLNFDVEVVEIL